MIKRVDRKSMVIRPSGRSTDFITPSFGYGCLYNCSYCYMKRHLPEGLTIAKNVNQILTEVNNHSQFAVVEKPNQTHNTFITYDISCNEDFSLHLKYHDWKSIFQFFKDSDIAMGSFATKFVNKKLLRFNPNKKIRIRFSLMPEEWRKILEPKTNNMPQRIEAISEFIEAGYEVHLNFSPVIVAKDWIKKYENLFRQIDNTLDFKFKKEVKAEVIFLTHNESKHYRNLEDKLPGENLLWNPEIQESKTSQYGGKNIRYKANYKSNWIKQFKKSHNEIIPWNTIRYIF